MVGEKRLKAVISGRVQGVFYRAFVLRRAFSLNLKGRVRNLKNGEVEVVAEGKKENLKKLISDLKKGPPLARVEKIDLKWEQSLGEFKNFEIVKD